MILKFQKGSQRKTEAYEVRLGKITVYISYTTVIAFAIAGKAYRQANHWGPTTGKHFSEMYCDGFGVIEDQHEFELLFDQMFIAAMVQSLDDTIFSMEAARRVGLKLEEANNVNSRQSNAS